MAAKPFLIVTDAITASTGLARIGRDLAVNIHKKLPDVFRVGTYGYGGHGSRHFGFQQYAMSAPPESTGFVLPELQSVWEDFAGHEQGIVFTIWDLSRLMWLAIPDRDRQLAPYPAFRQWLLTKPFRRWAYLPIDATGPNDKLTFPLRKSLAGFDRILAYSSWAKDICARSLEVEKDLDYLPHGIDTDVFFPTNQLLCRKQFLAKTGAASLYGVKKNIAPDEVLIGIVATNQHRKDFSLGIETASILKRQGHKVRLWIHTDALERFWSIPALLIDYGLDKDALFSVGEIGEESLAIAYSACDLTLGIGSEGWGYPLAESQACGTPVVHMTYAGGAEIVPRDAQVEPIAYRYEGLYACKRPVHDPLLWAQKAHELIGTRTQLDPRLAWCNLWPTWQTWLQKGIE